MKKVLVLIALFTILFSNAYTQNYKPVELAKLIFSKTPFLQIDKYTTCEYKGEPNGNILLSQSKTEFFLLEQTETKAVVAMTILDSGKHTSDCYLHFRKDSVWKLCAFRNLAMTKLIKESIEDFDKLTPEEIDKLIFNSKNNKNKKAIPFDSREDFYISLANAKLTIESDKNIIKHFYNNQAEFERIKDMALKELDTIQIDKTGKVNLCETSEKQYEKLLISSITFSDEQYKNCLNFKIGGLMDNTVGYFYVKDLKDLPEMTPDDVIMLREIGEGWYLYKTT